jgi:hypothetical protein
VPLDHSQKEEKDMTIYQAWEAFTRMLLEAAKKPDRKNLVPVACICLPAELVEGSEGGFDVFYKEAASIVWVNGVPDEGKGPLMARLAFQYAAQEVQRMQGPKGEA